jgi:hypothetical protein
MPANLRTASAAVANQATANRFILRISPNTHTLDHLGFQALSTASGHGPEGC